MNEAWDQLHQDNDLLFLGSSNTAIDLLALHPQQMHIFKLWQIYIENIDPLLKVTHTPTMQTRILDAASRLSNISPTFEALMFGIYCVSVSGLGDDDCQTMFGRAKQSLLANYRFGCRQALQRCEALRSDDRECLTALYLYLVSPIYHV